MLLLFCTEKLYLFCKLSPEITMTIRMIGIQRFRQNLTALLKQAQEKNIYFILMRHAVPIAKVIPLTKKEKDLEELAREVAEAREDFRKGNVHTLEEIEKEFGLR